MVVSLSVGDNGIINLARNATKDWEKLSANEQDDLKQFANLVNNNGNSNNNNGNGGNNANKEVVKEDEAYTCYYADVEGDGTVDGIIFADLAIGNTGDGQLGDGWGIYEIPVESGFKKYYIEEEEYEGTFGRRKVITPAKGSSGNERFYVMALDDFDESTHYWYNSAYGYLDNFDVMYGDNDFARAGEEPTGRVNTETMIAKWNKGESGKYGAQNDNDLWGIIQAKEDDGKSKVEKGWFVPSKSEWAAFLGEVYEPLNITTDTYDDYGLSMMCWSSTQYPNYSAYCVNLYNGLIRGEVVNNSSDVYVRLATTF